MSMAATEYFIRANSFAAPFVSDESTKHVTADTPGAALEKFAAGYKHPAGLYSARCYASADAMHKGEPHLAEWLCNHEQAKQRATAGKSSYGFHGHGPGDFEIDGERIKVAAPHEGSVVLSA
jgi:hypothetical protein